VPRTAAHTLFSAAAISTIMRMMGQGPLQILLAIPIAALVDAAIDAGHSGGGRSAVTHSLLSIPFISLASYLLLKAIWAMFCIPIPLDDGWLLAIPLLTSSFHLLWDSLTIQGIHVPLAGWVSLGNLSSRGAAANLIPTAAALLSPPTLPDTGSGRASGSWHLALLVALRPITSGL